MRSSRIQEFYGSFYLVIKGRDGKTFCERLWESLFFLEAPFLNGLTFFQIVIRWGSKNILIFSFFLN